MTVTTKMKTMTMIRMKKAHGIQTQKEEYK